MKFKKLVFVSAAVVHITLIAKFTPECARAIIATLCDKPSEYNAEELARYEGLPRTRKDKQVVSENCMRKIVGTGFDVYYKDIKLAPIAGDFLRLADDLSGSRSFTRGHTRLVRKAPHSSENVTVEVTLEDGDATKIWHPDAKKVLAVLENAGAATNPVTSAQSNEQKPQ